MITCSGFRSSTVDCSQQSWRAEDPDATHIRQKPRDPRFEPQSRTVIWSHTKKGRHEKEVKSAIVAVALEEQLHGREVATIEHAINIILIIPLSFLPLSRRCRFSVGETGMRHGVASEGSRQSNDYLWGGTGEEICVYKIALWNMFIPIFSILWILHSALPSKGWQGPSRPLERRWGRAALEIFLFLLFFLTTKELLINKVNFRNLSPSGCSVGFFYIY
jgi:hypothetical protein